MDSRGFGSCVSKTIQYARPKAYSSRALSVVLPNLVVVPSNTSNIEMLRRSFEFAVEAPIGFFDVIVGIFKRGAHPPSLDLSIAVAKTELVKGILPVLVIGVAAIFAFGFCHVFSPYFGLTPCQPCPAGRRRGGPGATCCWGDRRQTRSGHGWGNRQGKLRQEGPPATSVGIRGWFLGISTAKGNADVIGVQKTMRHRAAAGCACSPRGSTSLIGLR